MDEEIVGLDFDMEVRDITLVCNDGAFVKCPSNLLEHIPTLNAIQENDTEVSLIRLSHVSGRCMEDILVWVRQHLTDKPRELPMPLPHYNMVKHVGQWDADYLKSFGLWYLYTELIQSANYLGLTFLTEYALAELSIRMKDRTAEETWDLLDADGDLTRLGLKKEMYMQEDVQKQALKEWVEFLEQTDT